MVAGTLKAGANFAFSEYSAMTVNIGGTLDLGGFFSVVTLALGRRHGDEQRTGPRDPRCRRPSTSSTFSGSIRDGTSTTGLMAKCGTTTLTLIGTNTYTGPTSIGGTLRGGAPNTFSAASPTSVATSGTLDLGGFTQTINNVTLGGGTIQNGSLIGAIVGRFVGIVSGIGGPASLTTSGTVDMENGNSFTGPTVINSGGLMTV